MTGKNPKYILGICFGITVVVALSLGWGWYSSSARYSAARAAIEANYRSDKDRIQAELAITKATYEQAEKELVALKDDYQKSETKPDVRLSNSKLKKLQEQGLTSPADDLVTALQKRPDLIPFKESFGGEMRFQMLDLWVITDHWVLAHFDNGHNGGYLLAGYEVQGGSISWNVLAAERG